MPNPNTKGISVHVDRELHAEITAYLQEHNMKMADFIALAAQDMLRPPAPEIDPDLHAEIMAYLEENDMTMDEFFARAAQKELHPQVQGIDARLQAEIDAYLAEHDMTMDEFIALAAQDELHPKTPEMEGKSMKENTRTLAFQVPESLYQRVNAYKERNHMTLRSFVLGLIEEELDRDEELLRKQQEDAASDEEETQGEALAEGSEASVSEGGPDDEYEDEQEETPAVGDSEGRFGEPDEEDSEPEYGENPGELPEEGEQDEGPDMEDGRQETAEVLPGQKFDEGDMGAAVEVDPRLNYHEDEPPLFPEPDDEEDQEFGGMEMLV